MRWDSLVHSIKCGEEIRAELDVRADRHDALQLQNDGRLVMIAGVEKIRDDLLTTMLNYLKNPSRPPI